MKFLDTSVSDYFKTSLKEGDIGLEIEMECSKYFEYLDYHSPDYWKVTGDGSLKINGLEFVMKNPKPIKSIPKVMASLTNYMKKHGIEPIPSIRAGTHLHINMQKLSLNQVANFLTLYYPLEKLLLKECGENREGNLFCLRSTDCPSSLWFLRDAFLNKDLFSYRSDNFRYQALNLQSLFKYGSIEFRALPSTLDTGTLLHWSNLFLNLRDKAVKVNNCWEILEQISYEGPENFVKEVLGDHAFKADKVVEVCSSVYEGLREIQPICYAIKELRERGDK